VSESTSGRGVYGLASATTAGSIGVIGGTDSIGGTGVDGWAITIIGTNYGIHGFTNSSSGYAVYAWGNMGVHGDFTATGTKAAIVETQAYGWRSLYAVESPQNWFEDFGQATLSAGETVVPIEPVFAQTVNLNKPHHVFPTPMGDCSLYLADKSATAFTVRVRKGAGCEISFEYRIIAPRLDYEDLRLKEAEDPQAVAASAAGAVH
jgi:hypothetical protein